MMSKQKSIWKRTAIRHAFQRLMFGEDGTAGAVLVEATIIVPILVVMSIYAMILALFFITKWKCKMPRRPALNGLLRIGSIIAIRMIRPRRRTPHRLG